jgi:DNA-binding response OmpR family regulator
MESRTVLVADDDEDAAMSLGELLSLMGHDVCVALDASTAVSLAARHQPRLVLIEIGMQGGAGLDACREIRDTLRADSAVVALSAWTRNKDLLDAYEAGCSLYLFKPAETRAIEALLVSRDTRALCETLREREALWEQHETGTLGRPSMGRRILAV